MRQPPSEHGPKSQLSGCVWELRAVVQGGLRILDRIEAQGYDTFTRRPHLGMADAQLVLWRAVRMKKPAAGAM